MTLKSSIKDKITLSFLVKTSTIIFLFLIGAKALNFFKKILIGQCFGVSRVADAFFSASFLPYHVAIFFEGAIFLGFLPIFTQLMKEKGKEQASQFVVAMLLIFFIITLFATVLISLASPWITQQLVPGFHESQQALTMSLFQVMSLVIIFISLTSFFRALNSYFGHYTLAASSGFLDSAVMIGFILLSWKIWGIYAAAWGAVAGAFGALIVQAVFLHRNEINFFQKFSFSVEPIKKFCWLLIPIGMIWMIRQFPLVVLYRFGSGMWEGTISSLIIAQSLTAVLMGLMSHTVLLMVFPSLAKQANEKSHEEARTTFFQTMRAAFFILIPIGFLITGLARPIAVLLFPDNTETFEGARRIANSLICFGWATFALYAELFMTQSFIAIQKTIPAVLLCIIRAVLTYLLCYVLVTPWDYQGLAFGFSLASVINLFIFFPLLFRSSIFSGRWLSLFIYTIKLLLASSPILLAGWFLNRWTIQQWTHLSKGIVGIIIILSGGVLVLMYLLFLYWFRLREFHFVWNNFKKSWSKKGWSLVEVDGND